MVFTKKNKEGVRAIWAINTKPIWLENILAHAHLSWRRSPEMEYSIESKDGTTSMKIVN